MQKNTASQKIEFFAFDATTGLPKSGDAANLTACVSKDFGAATVLADTSATEIDAVNAKGWYVFDLAQAETNADHLLFTGKSSTANISVVGRPVETTPANFAATSIDSSGRLDVIKVNGTSQTARDLGASVIAASVAAGVTVTTNNDKNGYSLAVTPPTAAQIAAVILTTPANLLVTDSSGRIQVQSGTATGQISLSAGAVLLQATQTGVTIPTVTTVGTVTTLTNAPSDSSGTTTLLGRLTSARAGYLDTLSGIVAAIWAAVADSSGVTTLLARLTSTRAGYLDNLSAAPPTLAAIRADLERNGGSLYNAGAAATAAANNAAAIIDTLGAPAGVSIAADIAAIDTGGGGASVEDIVDGMTTAGFAKIPDVQNTYDLPVQ